MGTVSTNEFKSGLKVMLDGDPCSIVENEFVKPGKGQAFSRVKIRNLKNGRVIERTFKSGDTLEAADVVDMEMQYLYNDGQHWYFMNPENFEQIGADTPAVEDAIKWLKAEDICMVTLWNGVPLAGQGARMFRDHPRHDGLCGRAGEWRIAGEHLVQHAAQRVDIASGGDLPLAHRLFRAHVVGRAEGHASLGHPGAGGAHRQRNAEVGHEGRAVVQQDVLGLDVPVDDAMAVGVVERRRRLGRDPQGVGHRELLLATDPVADRLPLYERHDIVEETVGVPRVDQAEDVGVLQVGRRLDLGQEPLRADDGAKFRAQHLHRYSAVMLEVLGEIDRGHAPLAQLPLDAVAVGEGSGQSFDLVGHVGLNMQVADGDREPWHGPELAGMFDAVGRPRLGDSLMAVPG